MNVSVLLSAYINCRKEYISQALHSVYYSQTLKPKQIVLILDGPVKPDLYGFVFAFKQEVECEMIIHKIAKSKGSANALNVGIELCTSEYIAKMDSDDVCLPNRFKDQVDYLVNSPKVDVVGSWISEIDEKSNIIKKVVKYPETHEQCLAHFKCRSPLAHPSVMFRKSFFEKAGKYPTDVFYWDDVSMWHQGFINGCVFANVPKICLQFRRSSDFYKRRRNIKALIVLLKYRISSVNPDMNYGITGNFCALLYFMIQLLPSFVKKIMYNNFR